jgi:ankyrin repeat protein
LPFLAYLVKGSDQELIKAFLAAEVKVDAQNGGKTALMFMAQDGNLEAVDALLEAGADPEVRDSEGHTAVFYALIFPDVTARLLQANAEVNVQTYTDLTTPLILAAIVKYMATLQLLLDAKADPTLKDSEGKTALHYAIEKKMPPESLEALIAKGADIYTKDNAGKSPLDLLKENGHAELAESFHNRAVEENARKMTAGLEQPLKIRRLKLG